MFLFRDLEGKTSLKNSSECVHTLHMSQDNRNAISLISSRK